MGLFGFIEEKQQEAKKEKRRRQEHETYLAECRKDKDFPFDPDSFRDFKERYLYIPLSQVSPQPKADFRKEPDREAETHHGAYDSGVRFSLCSPPEPRKYPYPPKAEGEAFDRLIQFYQAGDFTGMREELSTLKATSFADGVKEYMEKKGLSAVTVYTNADVLKQTFSKIMNHEDYHVSKDTALQICLALHLTYEEARDLIGLAGYTFSNAIERDLVFAFFFKIRHYQLSDINEALYGMKLKYFEKLREDMEKFER